MVVWSAGLSLARVLLLCTVFLRVAALPSRQSSECLVVHQGSCDKIEHDQIGLSTCCALSVAVRDENVDTTSLKECSVEKRRTGEIAVLRDSRKVLLTCFNSTLPPSLWISCEGRLYCVLLASSKRTEVDEMEFGHINRRTLKATMLSDESIEESTINGHFIVGVVISVALIGGVLLVLVILCAGGGDNTTSKQNPPTSTTTARQKEENETVVIKIEENGNSEIQEAIISLQGQQDNDQGSPQPEAEAPPPQEVEGEIHPNEIELHVAPSPPPEPEDEDNEDDPRYEPVNIALPHPQEEERQQSPPAQDDSKISYGVVTSHPGQPPYASVGEVLPQPDLTDKMEDQQDEQGYDLVRSDEESKDDYAEVRKETTTVTMATETAARNVEYDTIDRDSLEGDGTYDTVKDTVSKDSRTASQGSKDSMYEVVLRPSVGAPLSPRQPEAAPDLPPMRVKMPSASEDDVLKHDKKDGKKAAAVGKEKIAVREKDGKHSKDVKHIKDKKLSGIFRSRASTVSSSTKGAASTSSSTSQEVAEGPPLPPNHPAPNTQRAATLMPGLRAPMALPSEELEDDVYDEPFDSGPRTGPPRKVSNVAKPGEPFNTRGMTISVGGRTAPNVPLPEVPMATASQEDPEYESVTPATKKKITAHDPKDEKGGLPQDEEEGESPYDSVTKVPGTAIAVGVGSMDEVKTQMQNGTGNGNEDDEETPYDTVAHIPGTSIPLTTKALKPTISADEHPYSKIKRTTKPEVWSDDHKYSLVDKSLKQAVQKKILKEASNPVEHDEMGYAVVSEEFKRARTLSKGLTDMRKVSGGEDPYSTVNDDLRLDIRQRAATSPPSSTPSPPPPISPIKDTDIIQEFCPPPTPPHPLLESSLMSDSITPTRQLDVGSEDNLSPKATDMVNHYDVIDDDLRLTVSANSTHNSECTKL